MNTFLSMQQGKSESQENCGTKQDDVAVQTTKLPHVTAESNVLTQKDTFQDTNNNDARLKSGKSEKAVNDLNNEDPVINEELRSGKLNRTGKCEKSTKGELKKRTKTLRIKELILGKRETTSSKIRKERSYSENDLHHFSRYDGKANDNEKHTSFDKFRKEMNNSDSSSNTLERMENLKPKRSASKDNLDYVSKAKVPRQTWIQVNLNRDRSSSCPTSKDGSVGKDSKHTRRKVVKRDSWFLIRKQKMEGESPHILEKELILKEQEGNDMEKDLDSEKQFGEITQTTSGSNENPEKNGRDVPGKTCSDPKFKNQKTIRISKSDSKFANPQTIRISKSDSKFENQSKNSKQKIQDEPSENLEEISHLKGLEKKNGQSEKNSESQLKNTKTKHPHQVLEDSKSSLENKNKSTTQQTESLSDLKLETFNSDDPQSKKEIDTEASELNERNESLRPKENTETDIETSKDRPTLLTIANQLVSEKYNSKLSTWPSVGTVNESRNRNRAQTKPVCGHSEESHQCQKINELANDTMWTPCTHIEETTPVDAECSPPLVVNNENLDLATKSQCTKEYTKSTQGDSNDQNSDEDEFLANQKFENDIRFIDAEAKRSLRSEEYLERARKRCLTEPKSSNTPTLVLKGMALFSSNLAGGVFTVPLHLSN